jgi:hypothetical protein
MKHLNPPGYIVLIVWRIMSLFLNSHPGRVSKSGDFAAFVPCSGLKPSHSCGVALVSVHLLLQMRQLVRRSVSYLHTFCS